MNGFYEKQNEPHMLKLLAGQRQIYSDVKAILMKSFCAGVVMPSVLSFIFFVMSFYPGYTAPWVKTLLTIYGLAFFIINHFILEHISNCKKKQLAFKKNTTLVYLTWSGMIYLLVKKHLYQNVWSMLRGT